MNSDDLIDEFIQKYNQIGPNDSKQEIETKLKAKIGYGEFKEQKEAKNDLERLHRFGNVEGFETALMSEKQPETTEGAQLEIAEKYDDVDANAPRNVQVDQLTQYLKEAKLAAKEHEERDGPVDNTTAWNGLVERAELDLQRLKGR